MKSKIKKITKKNIVVFVILFALISVGMYLRIGGVLSNSFAFTYDVGRDLLKVQEIVNGNIPLIGQTTGLGGLFYGPWWYYILTPPFVVSQGNPQGVAFFMVLVGAATILAGYYLGKIVGGRRLGIIFASLTSFSPVMIGYSNQIWNPNIAPLFVFLVFIVIEKLSAIKYRFLAFIALGLLFGLIADSEILFGVLFSLGIFLSLFFQYKKKLIARSTLGIFIGLFVIVLPRIVFEIRHNFIMSKTMFSPKENNEGLLSLSTFFTDIPSRILTIFYQFSETVAFSNVIMALCMLLIFSFLILKTFKKIPIGQKRLLRYGLVIILAFVLGTSMFDRAIWGHYLVGLPVLYILFVGIGFSCLFIIKRILALIVFTAYILFMINPVQVVQNYTAPMWEGNAAVYRNQLAVLDYIYDDANGQEFNYIAYTPAVHDYPYQYLFSWYGESEYGYAPAVDTKDLLYVILEPDPGYEGRLTDWLKIREGDGKIVNEKEVKGGIKVQRRMR